MKLVLLPGLDGTGRLFERFLAALPAGLETCVVAYPDDRALSLDQYADHALAQFPEGPVALLAESFSGLVALKLLVRPRTPVRRVVFAAAFAAPPRPFLRAAARLPGVGRMFGAVPDFALRGFCLGSDARAGDLESLRAALSKVSRDVLADRIGLVGSSRALPPRRPDVPCLYLQATADRLVPGRAALWFREHFTHFTLVAVDGPHLLLQTRPGECAREVARFVE